MAKAMRLTRAGEYAVRCMLYLSSLGLEKIGNRKEIAKAIGAQQHRRACI